MLGCHYYMVYCMDHLWKMLSSLLCSPSRESLCFIYLFSYLCILGDKVLLCGQDCAGVNDVSETGLELVCGLPASASCVPGL